MNEHLTMTFNLDGQDQVLLSWVDYDGMHVKIDSLRPI